MQEATIQGQRERMRLEMVLDSIAEGVISMNGLGVIETFNPAAEQLFGYLENEMIGKNASVLFAKPHDYKYLISYMTNGAAKVIGLNRELEGLHCDGQSFPMELNVSQSDHSKTASFTAVVRNISERKKYIAELQKARQMAEAASRVKSDFLANMSHEIRTPMNGVIGMIDVLHQTSLKGYQVEMVELIQESATSLLGILNDILDLSKIEAGKLDIISEPFDPEESLELVCHMLNRFAEKAEVALTIYADPRLPHAILGDNVRFRQILVNLVGNAIKFTGKVDRFRQVSVSIVLNNLVSEKVAMDIVVTDNGIGMNEAVMARIFNNFEQAEQSIGQKYGGTGLGLSITRRLVTMMGGDIRVASQPGLGSTFRVRLALPVAPPGSIETPRTADVSGIQCLVMGRGKGLATDLAYYLECAGACVERRENREAARSWIASAKPSGSWVLVLDAGETHISEEQVKAEVDMWPDLDANILAVIIERGGRKTLRKLGENSFMIDGNVLTRRVFLRAIAVAAGREPMVESRQTADSPGADKAPLAPSRTEALSQGRLVLVAEDNETNQKVLQQQLALLGVTADMVNNGQQALERFREDHYGLLLTDLHMPDLDGYGLVEAIREEERAGERIPVIAFTANAQPGERERCIALGMDDYLAKPARLDEIRKMLDQWLPPVSFTGSDILASQMVDGRALAAPINLSVLMEMVGSDAADIRDLLCVFQQTLNEVAEAIQQARELGDMPGVRNQAHKLKSSARTVGAEQLADLCAKLEQAAREGNSSTVDWLLAAFVAARKAVSSYLDSRLAEGAEHE
ncbi:PAS domain-containing hybrid sensor histidine kinase/response regulator [Porticoccus sp.]